MAKVYVVTTGSYSDYSIYEICSTEENALAVAEALRNESSPGGVVNDIEVYELDQIATMLEKGHKNYRVSWTGDYQDVEAKQHSLRTGLDGKITHAWWDKRHQVWVSAKDEEHAKKIALEHYIQWKAAGSP